MWQVREGLLVTLTEEGAVAVTFLGTRPTLFSAAPPDSREVTRQINNIVKLREREGQRVDLGRSLKGHL